MHERSRVAQAVIVGASFAMLFVGSNAANPLLPLFRDRLDFDPLTVSLMHVYYVTVLALTLLALAHPRLARHAPWLLPTALGVAIVADLLLAHATEWSVLLGRAVTGISGGLGTGAAAALVVAAIGARGRGLAATGNLVGAVIGSCASQLVVSLLPRDAPTLVFLGHASLLAVCLAAAVAVLVLRRRENAVALAAVAVRGGAARPGRSRMRMFVTGSIAWISASAVTALGATLFADLGQPLVQAVGPTLYLGVSAVAQLASPPLARVAPRLSGVLVIGIGIAGIVAGGLLHLDPLAIAGFGILGFGAGLAFRTSLVALTRGMPPLRQGSLASLFTAVTYGVASAAVLATGSIASLVGLAPATLGLFAIVGVASVVALLWAPRLRDTREDGDPAPGT